MTAKDKAKELVDKFYKQLSTATPTLNRPKYQAKQCALIAVDECLKIFEGLHKPEYVSFDIYEPKQYTMEGETDFNGYTMSEYWQQVKIEINNL